MKAPEFRSNQITLSTKFRDFEFESFDQAYAIAYGYHHGLSQAWLTWFIGFCEAECSFTVAKRGDLSFVVTQALPNEAVLQHIAQSLGFGRVVWQNKSNQSRRWIVQDMRGLTVLCALFNGNLVLPKRQRDLHRFLESRKSWLNRPRARMQHKIRGFDPSYAFRDGGPRATLTSGWLSGFSDGEACFHARVHRTKYTFLFTISQTGLDALSVLNDLLTLFQSGALYNHSQVGAYTYTIRGLVPCARVAAYFKAFPLRTTKRKSFARWDQLLAHLMAKDHLSPVYRPSLVILALSINAKAEAKDPTQARLALSASSVKAPIEECDRTSVKRAQGHED
jgi:hypothetical protein